jgi:uncharacterized membrane protein YhaH (DUF805 family)
LIRALFSFRGRLARLSFLGWTAALLAASVVGTLVAIALGIGVLYALHAAGAPVRGLGGPLGLFSGLVLLLLVTWSQFALAARRVRDMGLSPVLVLPLLTTPTFVLKVFVQGGVPDTLANVVGAAAFLWLLLWPGRAAPGAPPLTRRALRGPALAAA